VGQPRSFVLCWLGSMLVMLAIGLMWAPYKEHLRAVGLLARQGAGTTAEAGTTQSGMELSSTGSQTDDASRRN